MTTNWFRTPAPVTRRVRAYFAPVNRVTQTPAHFDPAAQGDFALDSPPAPWVDLGWIQNFTRKSTSKTAPLLTGVPAATLDQVRETLEAQVSFEFLSWTKLSHGPGHGLAAYESVDWRRCTRAARLDSFACATRRWRRKQFCSRFDDCG